MVKHVSTEVLQGTNTSNPVHYRAKQLHREGRMKIILGKVGHLLGEILKCTIFNKSSRFTIPLQNIL